MFFNARGIKWTIIVLLGVLALCVLDLHCSNKKDEAASSSVPSAISRVKGEIEGGKREYASMRADQLEEQLRNLRIMAKKLVREGKDAEARRVIVAIQEIEKDAKRLRERSEP